MKHLGDYDASAVLYGKFTTYRPSSGAAYTLAGTPALSVYKDNSTTQSTSGVTLTADFDSVTGLNHFAVDTSSDGTFYSAGSFFDVVITTGTVDGISVVGSVVASFTIRKNSALKPTTAGRTLDVSSGGEAGLDWANIGSPTTTVGLSGTTVKTATDVETDTADIQSRLPAALVSGRIDAYVGAMANNVLTASAIASDAITDAKVASDVTIASVTGAVGSVTGNVGGNVTGSVGSVATGGISSGSFAAGAIDAAAIATDALGALELAAGAASEIATAVRTELTTELGRIDVAVSTRASQTSVDTIDDFLDTEVAAIKAVTDKLDDTVEDDGGTYRFTANALEEAPSGTGASAASIVAAMFTVDTGETEADAVAGSVVYEIVQNAGGGGGLDAAGVRAAIGMASANLDTQLADLPTNAELATALASADDAVLSAIGGLSIPTAGAIADAVCDEALSGHTTGGTVGKALLDTDLRGARTVIRGTSAGSATTTTMTPSALSPAGVDADQFKGRILVFDNDTTTLALRGQATDITASTAASLPLLTFTALTAAPASGDTFSIL